MTVDITFEKNKRLSTQDMYDIIAFSISAAEDDGLMNSFVFSRALYLFASIIFFPERKDELSSIVSKNINEAWDTLIADGTIEIMLDKYNDELNYLAENAQVWFDEYTAYIHSARGLLTSVQSISGNIMEQAAEYFKKSVEESGASNVIEIADKWGMNNTLDMVEKKEIAPSPATSLFES